MKKYYGLTVLVCVLVLAAVSFLTDFWHRAPGDEVLKVGFVYSEDESTPYTGNFIQAQHRLEEAFPGRVQVMTRSNVLARDAEEPIRELIRRGCRLMFINSDWDICLPLAREYPEVQFCQISMPFLADATDIPENYHSFNGEIYQARYVSGVIAGMKLRQMMDSGALSARDAVVGYVGADSNPEVISGYTAFLLGVRSVAPEARMRVRYVGSWNSYNLEKERTRQLIDEGCVIIAEHTNTIAPAVACEEATQKGHRVYYIGYHQTMMDIAPSCTLVSLRTNWAPYLLGATEALLNGETIEKGVKGHVHGATDMSAGFEQDWVQMLELNKYLAADGTGEKMERIIENLKAGKLEVFKGNYTGVDPENPADTIDLSKGYTECRDSSGPSFHYILKDYITIE